MQKRLARYIASKEFYNLRYVTCQNILQCLRDMHIGVPAVIPTTVAASVTMAATVTNTILCMVAVTLTSFRNIL